MSSHLVEPEAKLSLLGITGTFKQISRESAGIAHDSGKGAFFIYDGPSSLGGHNGVLSTLMNFTGAAQALVHTGKPERNGTLIQLLDKRTTSTRNTDRVMSLA